MTPIEAWVQWYEANDLVYFPLYGIMNGACRCREGAKCDNPGKHPIYRWKDQPRRMPTELDNVGISTDNLVVIDLDDPAMDPADYPETFMTTTGKGWHLWYRASDAKQVRSIVGWRRKVDIRAHGGLIAAPPSRHKSGAEYRAANDSPIVLIPNDLLYALPERTSNYQRTGLVATESLQETPEVMFPMVATLVQQVLNYDTSRNVTLFKVACRYYEMATKNMLGTDALDEIIQAALATGLTPDEISRTLASARRSI